MTKRKWKRGLAAMLVTAFCVGAAGGCGKEQQDSGSQAKTGKEAEADKGRYVEREEAWPEELADWTVLQIFTVQDKLHLLASKEEGGKTILREWERQESGYADVTQNWLASMELGSDGWLEARLMQAEDGTQYLYAGYMEEELDNFLGHLWRGEGDAAVEITPEKWSVPNETWGGYEMIQDLAALNNGTLAAASYSSMDILSGADGKVLESEQSPAIYESRMVTDGENVYLGTSDGNGFQIEKRAEGKSSDVEQISFAPGGSTSAGGEESGMITVGGTGSLALSVLKDGTLIAAGEDGIFRLAGGSPEGEWEKLAEGVDTNFAMRDYTCLDLAALEDGSIYALFETGGEVKLYRYEYDPDAVSQVTQVLKLYTVYENPVLTQAAVMYHKAHPEVMISIENEYPMYYYGDTDYDAVYQKLNTMLMGDDAPDILMMDHLNTDAYAQKGLLEELEDVVGPMEESGELLSNITNAYVREDGKRYVVPLQFGFMMAVGRDIVPENMESMEALAEFLAGADYSYMGKQTAADLVYQFYTYFCDEIVDGKQLNREKLSQYLRYLKAIGDNCGIIDVWPENERAADMWDLSAETKLAFQKADGFVNCMIPVSMAEYIKGDFTAFENRFIPSLEAGICAKSQYVDTAKDFLRFALSEEFQSANGDNGFPVNRQALKTQAAKDRSEFQIYTSIEADDGSYVGFESKSYSQETADRLAAMCETLDKPVKEDAKIRQVLAECLGEYLKGAQPEEETVQKIEEELKMYLAE
ncbi:MAG: extracellular solute-binding protein [Lachnospiraceae bacterium]|nr:extracellular solute-binding protein [uncultured Acetatifactor sp.]MCI8286438.1 extracellular solute-binding protein [Lachnospiraceae bacterium]